MDWQRVSATVVVVQETVSECYHEGYYIVYISVTNWRFLSSSEFVLFFSNFFSVKIFKAKKGRNLQTLQCLVCWLIDWLWSQYQYISVFLLFLYCAEQSVWVVFFFPKQNASYPFCFIRFFMWFMRFP